MKESRLEVYNFNVGSFVNDANLNTNILYSDIPINGEIVKVAYTVGTWAQAGSLNITVSGTNEPILYMNNNLNASQIVYPIVYPVSNLNVTGSPQAFMRRVLGNEGILKVSASGVGPIGSICNGLSVYYRC
jgi:spore germination protein YaaH